MGFKSFSSIMMQLFSQDEEKYTVTSALKTIVKIDKDSMQYNNIEINPKNANLKLKIRAISSSTYFFLLLFTNREIHSYLARLPM